MKIDIVGNCCTWTKELATSFIINDEILFDGPEGSFKTLLHNYDLNKINYIIITHFHSDHFLDVQLVIEMLLRHLEHKTLTILAPAGCFERLCALYRLIELPYMEQILKERVSFIVCENGKKVKLGKYNIECYKMTHGELDAYGFVIDDGSIKVGFSGDTSMCNNVIKIIKKSSVCFIDTAEINLSKKHLSVKEVLSLQKEFPKCKLEMIHLSEYSKDKLDKLGLNYLKQGDKIIIE